MHINAETQRLFVHKTNLAMYMQHVSQKSVPALVGLGRGLLEGLGSSDCLERSSGKIGALERSSEALKRSDSHMSDRHTHLHHAMAS